ncbi:hypothetical protein X801_06908, partial [Opisthorchis viverrini]
MLDVFGTNDSVRSLSGASGEFVWTGRGGFFTGERLSGGFTGLWVGIEWWTPIVSGLAGRRATEWLRSRGIPSGDL